MPDHFIIVSGNIAAGKSTLTKALAEHYGWKPFYEAFEENPYLADFYDDMPRWSFQSQVYFLARRLQHHKALWQHPGPVVQDRSIYEDAEIFARNLHLQGNMSERDYSTYRHLYNGMCEFLPPPTLVIYLEASVDVLLKRIADRNRSYEQQIPREYLTQINTLYAQWAAGWTRSPLISISAADYDFANQLDDLDTVLAIIDTALQQVIA